jgi:hypothetical protein
MPRGRPPTLKDRKTTTVSLEHLQAEYILNRGIDLSKFVRDNIDALMQAEESTVEKLERENEECSKIILECETKIRQNTERIRAIKEGQDRDEEAKKAFNELDEQRREHFITYMKNVNKNKKCTSLWLDYLTEGLKFASRDEAKAYAKNFWIDNGIKEDVVNSFLRL